MPAKRKRVTMMVTVSVPADLSAADARREVRTLITHQANWLSHLDTSDVKCVGARPVPRNSWDRP